jgi:hypothetical protein
MLLCTYTWRALFECNRFWIWPLVNPGPNPRPLRPPPRHLTDQFSWPCAGCFSSGWETKPDFEGFAPDRGNPGWERLTRNLELKQSRSSFLAFKHVWRQGCVFKNKMFIYRLSKFKLLWCDANCTCLGIFSAYFLLIIQFCSKVKLQTMCLIQVYTCTDISTWVWWCII